MNLPTLHQLFLLLDRKEMEFENDETISFQDGESVRTLSVSDLIRLHHEYKVDNFYLDQAV